MPLAALKERGNGTVFATTRIHHRITTNAQMQPPDAFGVSLQCVTGL